jgi:hypothetical protein
MERLDDIKEKGDFKPFELEGEKETMFYEKEGLLLSCNAYIGAFPVAQALKSGAQVVITGRVVDSAIALGPLIHEYGWGPTQYDLLSAGSLAGHIIECGCHATGGNFTDWKLSLGETGHWSNVGFPIAEVKADGSFVVTKGEGTDGVVSPTTVGEQLLYEIANPGAYLLPDVSCDWRNVTLKQIAKDRVLVQNAKGNAPSEYFKVSVTALDGNRISGSFLVTGFEAKEKAQAVCNAILQKTRRILKEKKMEDFRNTLVEYLGAEHSIVFFVKILIFFFV